jgi:hypothetical protein
MSTASLTEGTIGIENPAETIGLQYLFDGALDVHAMPVANGMCILYTTMTGLPTLDVTITPVNPPIVIPATGGSFNYSVLITNPGTNTTNFDVWVMVTMPNGTNFGPVLTRLGMSLTPGGQLVRAMTQVVPASAPSGNYTYIMYGGNYNSGLVYDQSSFDFSKQGAFDNGSNSSDWEITGWEEELSGTISLIPEEYALFQNYPNPFNPVTSISYALPSASYVHLSVYNTIGQQMAVLVDGWQSAGNKSVNLDASNWSSGVYFYRLQAGDFKDMKKMILIK